IRTEALDALQMQDKTYGWTIEMQIKAARLGLRIAEVPVSYRRRVGVSKITGTVSGTVKASWKILATIFRFAVKGGAGG
ncbi:MAG: glycosyltransferase family 2 protein, partial [Bacteroidetes bacterium]|nr:glycosyltransferase family 2 protein [Bacteroidota bacterium]